MRASANSMKRPGDGRSPQAKPKEGTQLRRYFDLALTGDWFDFLDLPMLKRSGVRNGLKESYELEFTTRRHPTTAKPFRAERQYRCTGRWDGADFIPMAEIETAIEYTQKLEA